MNKTQKKKLDEALSLIEQAKEIIGDIVEDEREKLDNMAEKLSKTDRFWEMEVTADSLDNMINSLEEAINHCPQ